MGAAGEENSPSESQALFSDVLHHLSAPSLRVPTNLPVGGRLSHFWKSWEIMGASSKVVEILREGFRLKFLQNPVLSSIPWETANPKERKNLDLQQHIDILLQKEAIEVVQGPLWGEGFYNRLFLVPKSNGSWRPIIDLKRLNRMLDVPRFKMETLQSIWNHLIPGCFTFSIDLSDAYFHIPIYPKHRKYLRFCFLGVVYQFRALPFGLSSAPWIFTKVMSEIRGMVHPLGILLLMYLDDWLVQTLNLKQGIQHSNFMVLLCQKLGLLINHQKSELYPTQRFQFIGALFDLILNRVYPKQVNLTKLQLLIHFFLSSTSATAKKWTSLLGLMASQYRFIKWGRLRMREIQWHLHSHWNQLRDHPYQKIPITEDLRNSLVWWLNHCNNPKGVPLIPPPYDLRLYTDASTQGWGGHAGDIQLQGVWTPQEQLLHINLLEMRAIRLCLQQLLPPSQSWILVSTDNSCVVAYINKEGGTRSYSLMEETHLLFNLIREHNWNLRATYIPGRLNVIADDLSRQGQVLPSEWSLHQDAVQILFRRWGSPLIDLFATRFNHKCPLFVSPVPDPRAIEVDALNMSLEGLDAYAYPPHQILSKFLQKVQMTKTCRLIVVAPNWPNQIWWPVLNQLSKELPVQLPHWENLLKQPRNNMVHLDPSTLNLHAWLIIRDL